MSGKVLRCVVGMGVFVSLLFTGCAKQTEIALKFSADDTATYKVSTKTIKDFRFEQISIDKVKEEKTGTTIEVTFSQRIESIDQNGDATAIITIDAVKYTIKDKSGTKFDFDSSSDPSGSEPFAKIIGQSYKISLSSDGGVKVIDAKDARSAVTSGYAGKVAKNFFSDNNIIKRHEILSLPSIDTSAVKAGDTWTKVEPPHRGMLAPKSFEKIYTLTEITEQNSHKVAIINMSAAPGARSLKDAGDMGAFANMFDTEETYTGQLVLNLDTGKISKYEEKLVAIYIATEPPEEQKSDKGPDSLTMGFTYHIIVETID